MSLFQTYLIALSLPYFTNGFPLNDVKLLNLFGDNDHVESHEEDTAEISWEIPVERIKMSNAFGDKKHLEHCEENAVVASWCDERVNLQVECHLQKELDEYGCNCYDNHAACPTECIGGIKPKEITRSGIYCPGIPEDTPNYILKEEAVVHDDNKVHCENNAIISSWCDEFMDPNLKCSIGSNKNEYICNCDGNTASCPVDCVGGTVPYKKDKHSTHCLGLPIDQPNYVIQPQNLLFKSFSSNPINVN